MAPTPLPTPDPTAPLLDPALSSKTIQVEIPKLYLAKNIVVSDNTDGFQTTLPVTTTDLMYASGYRVAAGSTYDYFKSDNFKIDNLGAVNAKGTITSTATGANSLAGSLNVASAVTAGSLSTVGALTVGSASVTGLLSSGSINSGAITSTATMTANNLKITSTNLVIDSTSATNSITLNGELKVNAAATGATVFKLDSTTGEIKTYGNISTTGTGTITAGGSITSGGAVSGAALNVGTLFKVDGFGAMTVKDAATTQAIYSFDKDGNFFTAGSLTASGTATLATGKFIVDGASGNLSTQGTISSGNVAVTGSLKTSGVVNIGGTDASPSIQLSNNGTSYFTKSVQIGDASNQKSILNADGTASFATGNFTVASTGAVVAKGSASFGDNAVALGYATGAMPANAKVSVDSSGNVSAAGTLAVVGNSTLTGSLSVASNKLTVNASGDLATTGVLSVSGGKLTADTNGNVVAAGTLQAATNKFTVNASGDVSTTGKLAVTGDSALGGKLDVSGNSTFAGTLAATGAVTAGSTLRVTSDATLLSKLAVAGDLAVNTDKFKVTAASGDVSTTGNLTVAGNANFSGNQIQLNTNGSLFAKNYLKTDFAVADYVKSTASDDVTTTIVPALGSSNDQNLFNSSTNKYLTTQEYVDRAVFKQAARLNLITKDVDTNLATFNNFSKVLAAIEGSSAATIVSGLVDSVDDIKVSVSDLMGGGYNSMVISCVPSVWGDAAAPEPIPTPISDLYKEDGWFYSNLSIDSSSNNSKINWYLPAYSGMKMKDITNLFMNNFLLSTIKLPKITIYTVPKNNSTDAISGVYNAKIQYNFDAALPSSSIAQRSALYIIDAPKNVYSDKLSDIKSAYSITKQGASAPVTTYITQSTLFSNSFDTSKVGSEDGILTFAIETTESNVKDYMFILQNFNISTKTGTTQMLFQNVSVVNDYLFKYFFRQHPDFSDASNNTNVVDKNTYAGYVSNILAKSLVTIPSSSIVTPESHITDITTLTLGGKSVTSVNQSEPLIFESNTTTVPMIVKLLNDNNKLTIKQGLADIVKGVAGDYNGTVTLVPGDNLFVVTVEDTLDVVHKTTFSFTAHVKSSDTRLSSLTVDSEAINLSNGNIPNGTIKNVVAKSSVIVNASANSSFATSVVVSGATGLKTGENTVTVKVTAEDTSFKNHTFVVNVLSNDTSLSTFTVNGTTVSDNAVVELDPLTESVTAIAIPTHAAFGVTAVISGDTNLKLGDNELSVLVTPQTGASKTYKVKLRVLDNNNNLGSLVINTIPQNLSDVKFTFASTTTSINVLATAVSSKATVSITGLPAGSDPVVPGTTYKLNITVTPERGQSKTYEYDVRIQSNDNSIDSVHINSLPVVFTIVNSSNIAMITSVDNIAPSTLSLQVNEVSPAILEYKIGNDDPTPKSITSGEPKSIQIQQNGDTAILVTIKPEDSAVESKTYTIHVRSRSNNTSLATVNGITVTPLGNSTVTANNNQTITLPTGVNDVTVAATAGYVGAKVDVDGEVGINSSSKSINVPAGTIKIVNIEVTATDGVTKTSYTLTFTAPVATPALSSITSILFEGTPATTNNNVDYYYTYSSSADLRIQINTTNTTNFSLTNNNSNVYLGPVENPTSNNYSFSTLNAPSNNVMYTIQLSNNGVNKNYYLHTTRYDAAPPAITSLMIESNYISSSNGVDYYYTSQHAYGKSLSIIAFNTTNVSITPSLAGIGIYPISGGFVQGTNGEYSYDIVDVDYPKPQSVLTITLSGNNINKIYYLHITPYTDPALLPP